MFMAWPDCSAGQSLRYEDSPWHQSLNGKWHFFYAADDHLLPHDATTDQPDTQGWSTISVPGNWEMQGHGTAIYTNHGYEFKPRNPMPPQPLDAADTPKVLAFQGSGRYEQSPYYQLLYSPPPVR